MINSRNLIYTNILDLTLLLAGIVFASGALFVSRIQEQPNA